jgi:hypothetical protein
MNRLLLATTGALLLFAGTAFAQAAVQQQPVPRPGQQAVTPAPQAPAGQGIARAWGPRFVDNDGDGVCDFFGWQGRGMGRNRAAATWGPRFVDRDGDGVCDFYPGGAGQPRLAARPGLAAGAGFGAGAGAAAMMGRGGRGAGRGGGRR